MKKYSLIEVVVSVILLIAAFVWMSGGVAEVGDMLLHVAVLCLGGLLVVGMIVVVGFFIFRMWWSSKRFKKRITKMPKKQSILSKAFREVTGYTGVKRTTRKVIGVKSKKQVMKDLTGESTATSAIASLFFGNSKKK